MPAKTKTEIKECTSLQIQKHHSLALLGIFLTQDPTGQGEEKKGSYINASSTLYAEGECDSMCFFIYRCLTGMATGRT